MKRKMDIMDMVEDILGKEDPELRKIVQDARKEKEEFDALDEDRKLLDITVYREETRIKFDVDKVEQMCVVANMAIDHILQELPRSKRKAVLMAAISGLEMRG